MAFKAGRGAQSGTIEECSSSSENTLQYPPEFIEGCATYMYRLRISDAFTGWCNTAEGYMEQMWNPEEGNPKTDLTFEALLSPPEEGRETRGGRILFYILNMHSEKNVCEMVLGKNLDGAILNECWDETCQQLLDAGKITEEVKTLSKQTPEAVGNGNHSADSTASKLRGLAVGVGWRSACKMASSSPCKAPSLARSGTTSSLTPTTQFRRRLHSQGCSLCPGHAAERKCDAPYRGANPPACRRSW